MSIRGYIVVQNDDETYEGFYNHRDSYPETIGVKLTTTPECINGNYKAVKSAIGNFEHGWTFKHETYEDAFNQGRWHGCKWFFIRRYGVWYCTPYYKENAKELPVVIAIMERIKEER